MSRLFMATTILVVAGLLMAPVRPAAQAKPDVALRAAMETETVKGDLKGAIEQYNTIAQTADRATAATALMRMADCYLKLGDAQARTIYERLVREFADQKEAFAIARQRLGVATAAVPAKGDRVVWSGPKVNFYMHVSPDGRFITYQDANGDLNLKIHDVVTNTDRPLTAYSTAPYSQTAGASVISKDGREVVYQWCAPGGCEIRILPLQATPEVQPRKLFASAEFELYPTDWSPDGRWIAALLRRGDGTTQIGLVAASDGALRVLKSVDWRGGRRVVFSPDGRHIAYDLAAGDSVTERHVFVMAIDGSSETTIVAERGRNVVMAWTPDGRDVLFASDLTGTTGLWAQTVANGKAQGQPVLLKRDIGSSATLGLTKTGTMYLYKPSSTNFVQVASLDLDALTIRPIPGQVFQRFVGSGGSPSWSKDGKLLAYRSCGPEPRAACAINIASVDTGDVRQGWPKLVTFGGFQLSADGKSFFAAGRDLKGRVGVYRIDTNGFEMTPVISPRNFAIEHFAADEQTVYFRRSDDRGAGLFARNLATSVEREIFRQAENGSMTISPDDQYIASVVGPVLYLVPTAGGAPRQVLRANEGEELDGFRAEWAPDGRSLILPKIFGANRLELWLVPMFDGGAPRKIDVDTSNWSLPGGGFAIHPSGRQIAYVGVAGRRGAEVWALENFLPARSAR